MSCISTGYTATCDNQKAPGGISGSLYFIDSQDLDVTYAAGVVTAITVDAGSSGWLEVSPKRLSARYVETAQNPAPDTVWEQLLTMTFPKRSEDLRNFLQTQGALKLWAGLAWR